MYKLTRKALFEIFKLGFIIGVRRNTTLPDKILGEELDKWIKEKLEGRNE
jgi:hypothetical protein